MAKNKEGVLLSFKSKIKALGKEDRSGFIFTKEWADKLLSDPSVNPMLSDFGGIPGLNDSPQHSGEIPLGEVSFMCTSMYVDDDYLVGEFDVLDTPKGRSFVSLLRQQKIDKSGMYNCVSLSGTGSVIGMSNIVDPDTYELTCPYFIDRSAREVIEE